MNVLHVTPFFYPATYWGGPIYSVYGLCNALAKMPSVTMKVLTTDAASSRRSDAVKPMNFPLCYPEGYEVYFCPRRWGDSVSPSLLLHLRSMIGWADVVHLNYVYSSPTIPTLLTSYLLGKPIVWTPRGALQRWEQTTKPMAKNTWEHICSTLLRPTRCVMHVTSKQEAIESRTRIKRTRLKIVPNGVNIPDSLPSRDWMPGGRLRALYMGRLHPIKGIENLLRALKLLNDPTVSLQVCGTGDAAYVHRLRQLVQDLQLDGQVSFRGHVDGQDKLGAFMRADVCIVPSFTENFGMVVAEALAHAVPVIAGQGTPWQETEAQGCGLWVKNSPDALASAIKGIRTKTLPEMGKRGREWMLNDFSWASVAEKMFEIYTELITESGKAASTRHQPAFSASR